jgi:glycosyltransferase involved in cell wall biosynthesis
LTGLLIDQRDQVSNLAAALIRILRDPSLAARMGTAGRAKAARTTWDHTAQALIALYRVRLAGGTRAR